MAESVFDTTFAATAIPALKAVFGGLSVSCNSKTLAVISWVETATEQMYLEESSETARTGTLTLDPADLATQNITISTQLNFTINSEVWSVAQVVSRSPVAVFALRRDQVTERGSGDRRDAR